MGKEKRIEDRKKGKYKLLHHTIDVSGSPPGKTAFGLFSINRNFMNKFYKDFKAEFPSYTSKRIKASRLKEDELKPIIEFMNSNDIQMRVARLENKDWLKYEKIYKHRKKYFKERMYGLFYSILLKTCSVKYYPYPVTLCKERYLYRPEVAINICKEISNYSNYDFSLSFGDRKVNTELRFADFVAGAAFKLNKNFLNKLENFHFIDIKLHPAHCLKVFGHYEK
ncbi:MAG: hypothetical protein ABH873_07920 [Candidatus Firestonebacteria bacterium]